MSIYERNQGTEPYAALHIGGVTLVFYMAF